MVKILKQGTLTSCLYTEKSELNGNYEGIAFLWNVMDRETRFLLASRIAMLTI
ncbi:hypothetical protein NVIE_029600 [Nitrososphaera viennensis EN76]|uniref:Uncharacterized protein n=1 Tax=Nitrososphaera viennensis EN76 TaxID=926571 RepID=A0A060HP17_9ARCH|nr:hypothetical protein NVIE_029600 [Nitrososphaera viennensis EN76]